MGTPILGKNISRIPTKVISDVLIYEEGFTGNRNIGYLEKASVKFSAEPKVIETISGESIQYGYDCKLEITGLQLYSLFAYEYFKNKIVTINFHPLSVYAVGVMINVSLDFTPGDVKGAVKLTATKFVERLGQFITGNPWGQMSEPWELPASSLPLEGEVTTEFLYDYVLRNDQERIEFVDPVAPITASSLIKEVKLTLVDPNSGSPFELREPINLVAKINHAGSWVTILADDWDLVYEDQVWKWHYASETTTFQMLDLIRLEWD